MKSLVCGLALIVALFALISPSYASMVSYTESAGNHVSISWTINDVAEILNDLNEDLVSDGDVSFVTGDSVDGNPSAYVVAEDSDKNTLSTTGRVNLTFEIPSGQQFVLLFHILDVKDEHGRPISSQTTLYLDFTINGSTTRLVLTVGRNEECHIFASNISPYGYDSLDDVTDNNAWMSGNSTNPSIHMYTFGAKVSYNLQCLVIFKS